MSEKTVARFIRITGLVQGVGFRPTVFVVAHELNLTGEVFNDAEGVGLTIEGAPENVNDFERLLREKLPALARIDTFVAKDVPVSHFKAFSITESRAGKVSTNITPDAATCRACLEDIFTESNRRYRYAFTNCTHCGPRYTITRHLPYDRVQTAMATFKMCPACQTEYTDPLDRRFHAQPNACPTCGPELRFTDMAGNEITGDPLFLAAQALRDGKVVAIKGLGGFHLACDANNPSAVNRLRERKNRREKPLAVMVANLESAKLFAHVSDIEAKTLTSSASPIVLLTRKHDYALAGIADGLTDVGIMVAYTPLHRLIFHELAGRPAGVNWLDEPLPIALVMTSANASGFPLVTENDAALTELANIADFVLSHNRPIVTRCDDSVVKIIAGDIAFIRRARGFVPLALKIKESLPTVLAHGAYLKNTVALTREGEIICSQHIADLDSRANHRAHDAVIAHMQSLYELDPQAHACDAHPDFYSTEKALQLAQENNVPCYPLYHHAAHVASVMAEMDRTEVTLGLSLDGVGLGPDGSAWGAELLAVSTQGFARLGHVKALPLPGGDIAAQEPARMGAAVLHSLGKAQAIAERFPMLPNAPHFKALIENPTLSPMATSMGRYFDAAAALLGLCYKQSDEAHAAMLLESAATVAQGRVIEGSRITEDLELELDALMRHVAFGDDEVSQKSADFHETLADSLFRWIKAALQKTGYRGPVVLTGGTFANRLLTESLVEKLKAAGIDYHYPRSVPAGDGGVAQGQAWLAMHLLQAKLEKHVYTGEGMSAYNTLMGLENSR